MDDAACVPNVSVMVTTKLGLNVITVLVCLTSDKDTCVLIRVMLMVCDDDEKPEVTTIVDNIEVEGRYTMMGSKIS